MSRGIGEFGPIQEAIPEWLAVIIALLTQFGDLWFLALLLGVLYWTRIPDQDGIAIVWGLLLTGVGFYRGLKEVFEFPRPDQPLLDPELLPWVIQPLWELTATAGGYGFPSGHATSSTIVYFGLATVLTVGNRRLRFVLAGTLVAVVSFSRIALGVHYLVDVVVGATLGGILLYVVFQGLGRTSDHRGTYTFVLAIVTGLFYVYTSAGEIDSILVLGAALGTFGGWQLVVLARILVVAKRPSKTIQPLLYHGGSAVVALGILLFALEEFPLLSGEHYGAGGAVGLITAAVVVLPIARHSHRVSRVLDAVSFWFTALGTTVRSRIRR